jgi:hypothetical protein
MLGVVTSSKVWKGMVYETYLERLELDGNY